MIIITKRFMQNLKKDVYVKSVWSQYVHTYIVLISSFYDHVLVILRIYTINLFTRLSFCHWISFETPKPLLMMVKRDVGFCWYIYKYDEGGFSYAQVGSLFSLNRLSWGIQWHHLLSKHILWNKSLKGCFYSWFVTSP